MAGGTRLYFSTFFLILFRDGLHPTLPNAAHYSFSEQRTYRFCLWISSSSCDGVRSYELQGEVVRRRQRFPQALNVQSNLDRKN